MKKNNQSWLKLKPLLMYLVTYSLDSETCLFQDVTGNPKPFIYQFKIPYFILLSKQDFYG